MELTREKFKLIQEMYTLFDIDIMMSRGVFTFHDYGNDLNENDMFRYNYIYKRLIKPRNLSEIRTDLLKRAARTFTKEEFTNKFIPLYNQVFKTDSSEETPDFEKLCDIEDDEFDV